MIIPAQNNHNDSDPRLYSLSAAGPVAYSVIDFSEFTFPVEKFSPLKEVWILSEKINAGNDWLIFDTTQTDEILSDAKGNMIDQESKTPYRSFSRLVFSKDPTKFEAPFYRGPLRKLLETSSTNGASYDMSLDWILIYLFAFLNPEIVLDYSNNSEAFPTYPISGTSMRQLNLDEITAAQKAMKNRGSDVTGNKSINHLVINGVDVYNGFLQFVGGFLSRLEEEQVKGVAFKDLSELKRIATLRAHRLFAFVFPETLSARSHTLVQQLRMMPEEYYQVDLNLLQKWGLISESSLAEFKVKNNLTDVSDYTISIPLDPKRLEKYLFHPKVFIELALLSQVLILTHSEMENLLFASFRHYLLHPEFLDEPHAWLTANISEIFFEIPSEDVPKYTSALEKL